MKSEAMSLMRSFMDESSGVDLGVQNYIPSADIGSPIPLLKHPTQPNSHFHPPPSGSLQGSVQVVLRTPDEEFLSIQLWNAVPQIRPGLHLVDDVRLARLSITCKEPLYPIIGGPCDVREQRVGSNGNSRFLSQINGLVDGLPADQRTDVQSESSRSSKLCGFLIRQNYSRQDGQAAGGCVSKTVLAKHVSMCRAEWLRLPPLHPNVHSALP